MKMEEKLDELIQGINSLAQPTFFDWLTLCISLVSVLISGVAIYYAIMVPQTLAKHKNRITLFEKRYELYLLLLDLHGVLRVVEDEKDANNVIVLTQQLEKLKKQLNITDNCKFYNEITTALNSPKYFFSFDISHPQYSGFQEGIHQILLNLRGKQEIEEEIEGIFENLEFFYETVKNFESYFYICPPKTNKN